MEQLYYETVDPESQGDHDPSSTPYAYYLQLWTPTGRQNHAIESADIKDGRFLGYDRQNALVVSFDTKFITYLMTSRSRVTPHTPQEMFEQELEEAQESKMRRDRAQKTLGTGEKRD